MDRECDDRLQHPHPIAGSNGSDSSAFGPDAPGFGLVLAGGGMRGGYQIGVWQALREVGIPITGVVGTSIGSVNAAIIAMDDFERAMRIWQTVEVTDIFAVTRPLPVPDNLIAWRNLPTVARMMREDHGLCVEPLRRLLTENIDEAAMRARGFPFGLLTYSLTEHKPLTLFLDDIPEGELVDYILGSCALPAFKALQVDGQRLLDGGVYNNRPTEMLASRGWRRIIEVEIHGLGRVRPFNGQNVERIRIEPDNNLFGPFNCQPEARRERIEKGHADALAALRRHGLAPAEPIARDEGGAVQMEGMSPLAAGSTSESTGAGPDRS